MIKLKIFGVTFNEVQAGSYALILMEENGERKFPVIIGTSEAQSISISLQGLTPPRPLTHDLFISFAKSLNTELKKVDIYKYEEGVFFSRLVFETQGGTTVSLDARTSDAISLAVRVDAPIFIPEEVLQDVFAVLDEQNWDESEDLEDLEEIGKSKMRRIVPLESMNFKELQAKLNEAIVEEDYEKASYIRDLIAAQRKEKQDL
jgi:bifunctional DNase/RNase